MKLLIASDLHGSAKYARALVELDARHAPDKILLLGDLLYHGPRNDLPEEYAPKEVIALLNGLAAKILAVRGNCDSEVDAMVLQFPLMGDYALVHQDGLSLLATHGHVYGPQNPPPLAPGDVLVCGHTHDGGVWKLESGNVYINPGSLSIPKGDGQHSYMVLEGRRLVRYTLCGQVLQEAEL